LKKNDGIFGISVKSYVRNTINLSCAKILLNSVISLYNINWLIFITEECVYCAVRTWVFIYITG